MCDKGQDQKPDHKSDEYPCVRQRISSRQCLHEMIHEEIQDAHTSHDRQIHDDGPDHSLLRIGDSRIGKRVFSLKLLSKHYLAPPSEEIFHSTARL